jgi:DNA-directed RNA polymerase specialized sigma24 family protein
MARQPSTLEFHRRVVFPTRGIDLPEFKKLFQCPKLSSRRREKIILNLRQIVHFTISRFHARPHWLEDAAGDAMVLAIEAIPRFMGIPPARRRPLGYFQKIIRNSIKRSLQHESRRARGIAPWTKGGK